MKNSRTRLLVKSAPLTMGESAVNSSKGNDLTKMGSYCATEKTGARQVAAK